MAQPAAGALAAAPAPPPADVLARRYRFMLVSDLDWTMVGGFVCLG